MVKEEYREIANQLSCPNGEMGKTVADQMFISNRNMIFKTIDRLEIKDNEEVLELGFGGGKHIYYVLGAGKAIQYTGIEISSLMVEVASKENSGAVDAGVVQLYHRETTDHLPYENQTFNHCFSVNTVYFWSDPAKQLQEIYRVLKSNGNLTICFIREDFISTQPFVDEEYFHFHKTDRLIRLMKNIGYSEVEQWQYVEKTLNKMGDKVIRPFIILRGKK